MKRHLFTAGGGLAGIFLTIALLTAGASAIQGRQDAATPDFTLETPDTGDMPEVAPETGDAISALPLDEFVTESKKPVRGIAPEQFFLPGDVTAKPLERIEPRLPLSQAPARPEPEPMVLRHPIVLSAGLIRFGDRLVQLKGMLPQQTDRTCGSDRPWPCGMVARTALRNFIRARALLCKVPEKGWQGTLVTACTVNSVDPAAWLAQNGWGEAPAGSPFEAEVQAAKAAGLGFFGNDPRNRGDPRDTGVPPVAPGETPLSDENPAVTETAPDL